MKYNLFISCLVVVILASAVSACIPDRHECKIRDPEDCCSGYCRDSKCIQYGDDPNDRGRNPCIGFDCPRRERCVLRQVHCGGQFPCRPKPECKPY